MRNMNNVRAEDTTQKTNNIEISMLNFNGEDNEHPKISLKCLDTYLTHRKIMTADRKIIIENCLNFRL
jgi:hypothetical protein